MLERTMKQAFTFMVLMGNVFSIYALPLPQVPTEPIYFEPTVEQASDILSQQSCTMLDNSIRYLSPYKESYKANFYQDKYNQVATGAMILGDFPFIKGGALGVAYLGTSYFMNEKGKEDKLALNNKEPTSRGKQVRAVIGQVITALTTLSLVKEAGLGISYLAYSSLVGEKEQRRVLLVKQQIAMLQQIKAEKHCFE